jgi:hypothetical protein
VKDKSEKSPELKEVTTIQLWDSKRGIGLEARVYQLHRDKAPQLLPMTESETVWDNGAPEGRKAENKAYNAVVPLEDLAKDDTGHKSATFLVALRFSEAELTNPNSGVKSSGPWPTPKWEKTWPLPTPKEIYEYIGVSPSSKKATGAMWDTVLIEQRKKSDTVLEFSDVNLIGRSLEKILQVDVIPVTFGTTKKQQGKALVSNLFVNANVDLEALL